MKEQSLVWKILAMIFISLFIIETIFVVWVWVIGSKAISQENKCASICGTDERYGIYSYDVYVNMCYCVTPNETYVLQEI